MVLNSRRAIDAVERYLGSDPGSERLRSGVGAVVGLLVALGASALFESLTHAFEVGPAAWTRPKPITWPVSLS